MDETNPVRFGPTKGWVRISGKPQAGLWIPCKDRLPPEGSKDLLVCWQGTDRYERADYWANSWIVHVENIEVSQAWAQDPHAPTHWCRVKVPE